MFLLRTFTNRLVLFSRIFSLALHSIRLHLMMLDIWLFFGRWRCFEWMVRLCNVWEIACIPTWFVVFSKSRAIVLHSRVRVKRRGESWRENKKVFNASASHELSQKFNQKNILTVWQFLLFVHSYSINSVAEIRIKKTTLRVFYSFYSFFCFTVIPSMISFFSSISMWLIFPHEFYFVCIHCIFMVGCIMNHLDWFWFDV